MVVSDYRPFRVRRKPSEYAHFKVGNAPLISEEDVIKSTTSLKVLNEDNYDPSQQVPLSELVVRIVTLAQVLLEKQFYPYQVSLSSRLIESLLLHDGDVITCLMSRQSGKTETVGGTVASASVALPALAKQFPGDWKLNITDDKGNYRGFAFGLKCGIYAPRLDQSSITFERVRHAFATKSAQKVMREMKLTAEVNNGNTFELSNGSSILCESASEQSKIEGATHHFLVAEECQDISDQKLKKSLHPMTAATMGTIAKIGTASTQKCDFYNSIQENRRMELLTGKRNHFFFPWSVCAKYNSLYRKYIEKERIRIGEESDEFRMSYDGTWIFERGMFVTQDVLFHPDIAMIQGLWSTYHWTEQQPGALKYLSLVAGIDWGSMSDSTVVCLMAVDWLNPLESGEVYDSLGAHKYVFYKKHVIGWLEFIGDNYEFQFGEIKQQLDRLPNLRKIIMDSNACGKPMYDRFAAVYAEREVEVEPFNFQPKVKSDGYKSLSNDLWAGRVTFPAGKSVRIGRHNILYRKFVSQTLDLKKEYRNGIMYVSHPDERGAHDDFPDSFMLASWGCNSPAVAGHIEAIAGNPFMN